jgi:basic membrane protein A
MKHSPKLMVIIFIVTVLVVGLAMIPGMAEAALKGKVAVVLDVGGRGDLSFNDMGYKGTDKAAADFGLKMVEIQSASASDYLPNVRNAARSKSFDLIISVGFLLTDAVAAAAKEYPDQKFMIIDSVVEAPKVMSIVFKANPNTGLLYTYTGTFSDIAKGKEATKAMLAQKAGLVYNVAGPLGIGDLQAITEAVKAKGKEAGPPFMLGVDANQDWMGDGHRVLASMLKRVDNACYNAAEAVVKGKFKGGIVVMGLNIQGVGISKDPDLLDFMEFGIGAGKITAADKTKIVSNWKNMRAQVPSWIWDAVADLEKQIISGKISVPNANTLEEMKAVRLKYPLKR